MRQENASSFEDEAEGFGKSLFLKVIKPEGREDRRSSKNAFSVLRHDLTGEPCNCPKMMAD
jgi:hypothetical protein